MALRRNDYLIEQNTLESRQAAYDRCQTQLHAFGEKIKSAEPDILVVMGDDHKEWYLDDVMPAISVYSGPTLVKRAADPEKMATDAAQLEYMRRERYGMDDQEFPCAADLAVHLVEELIEDEFDVASSSVIPLGADGLPKTLGHSYSFIYRRLLDELPIPMIPVVINTYFPPNQPSAKRCFDFGRAVAAAIESWGEDKKVCVIASGGLSHFAIDEEFDRRMLDAMQGGDAAAFAAEPDSLFQSGTSETKNWIAVAGSLADSGFEMEILDYVPCYRSEAGTGNAMAFATWQ